MMRLVFGMVLSLALASSPVVGAEAGKYTLQRGDTVRLWMLGRSDLALEAMIDIDGMITLPFIGLIVGENRTISELRDDVAVGMNGQIYRYINNEGVESFITIGKEDVLLVVAEYRPVAVYGAVRNAGQIPFRAGMTVRAALAMSGSARQALAANDGWTFLKAAELEGEVRALTVQRDHQLAVTWRLGREMERLGVAPPEHTEPPQLPAAVARKWFEQQNALLDRRMEAAQSQMDHLSRSIAHVDERLKILGERIQVESAVLAEDTEEKERIDKLFQRGMVSIQRTSDVRKSQLFTATRLLQTQDAVSRSKMNRMELERQMEQQVSDRLIVVAQAIEESELETTVLNAKIAAAQKELSVLGVTVVEDGQALVVQIHRGSGPQKESFPASMDDILRPGDILEVSYEWLNQ